MTEGGKTELKLLTSAILKKNCQLLTMGEGGQRSDFDEIVVRWVSRMEQENELVETLQSRDAKTRQSC